MNELVEELTELVRTVALAGRIQADDWVRNSGLTRQQAFTLGYIEEHQDRGVIARELAEMSGTTAASVTSLLQGLQERGYITREASEKDSRIKLIRATAEGVRMVSGFEETMHAEQERLFSALSLAQQEQLRELLTRLADTLEDVPRRPRRPRPAS